MDTQLPSARTPPAVPFALAPTKLKNIYAPFQPAERVLTAPTLPFDVQIAIQRTRQQIQIVQNKLSLERSTKLPV